MVGAQHGELHSDVAPTYFWLAKLPHTMRNEHKEPLLASAFATTLIHS